MSTRLPSSALSAGAESTCPVDAGPPDDWHSHRAEVALFLQQFRATPILYLPNPGNGGDSLIAAATYEAFGRAGVRFELASLDTDVAGRVVVLAGGGNLVPFYSDTRRALDAFLGRAARIVLLPHTIRGHEPLLERLDQTCTLFARDRASFDHVKAVNPSVDVRLAHDMAFHLDAHAYLRQTSEVERQGSVILEMKLSACGISAQDIERWPSVDLMRQDIESTQVDAASDADISDLFMLGVNPGEAHVAAWCFLRAISLARHVNTDRLHVGIGAALLGVPCTLRDNVYGKNSAVFNHSMSGLPGMRLAQSHSHESARARAQRQEIGALHSRIDDLQAECALLNCDFLKAQQMNAHAESELEAQTALYEALEKRCRLLGQSNANLHGLLLAQDALRHQLCELRGRNEALETDLRDGSAAVHELQERHMAEMQMLRRESMAGKVAAARLNGIFASRTWRLLALVRCAGRWLAGKPQCARG
ncbi:polysaccharide pyruvyl transferase family protein [Variovorax sp. OV329]|uniref:polysaccharide pyruvyl transferase family protein n=1 Tax=Variovorax sp. OV329 TaxID=1882825 RepID=UPI0008E0DD5C|nr:polysaccharide pyruvyl transferase family protein [Variovorax sp. OV329]SFM72093.1 Exopolysaccharide biosynthesis protein EpsI, predicted pyruvyl transferase [Variovorax sp. OV329]